MLRRSREFRSLGSVRRVRRKAHLPHAGSGSAACARSRTRHEVNRNRRPIPITVYVVVPVLAILMVQNALRGRWVPFIADLTVLSLYIAAWLASRWVIGMFRKTPQS